MTRNAFDADGQPLAIPCPNCGHETRETIGWFKRHGEYDCTGCDVRIAPDFTQLDAALGAVADRARKLFR